MIIALDSYVLREEGYNDIKRCFKYKVVSVELIAKEVLNAIYMAYRKGRISEKQAGKAVEALISTMDKVIQVFNQKELLKVAFKIS